MKVLLEIKDNKASFVMELLNNLTFVKAKPISEEQKKELKHIQNAFKQTELIKQGKLKTRPVEDLLNEL